MATVASLVVHIGADVADIKKNVEKIDGTLNGLEKTAVSMGKVLAGAFTIGAISAWTMKAVDAASQINNLSKKLGVSTDAVQRWSHAATMGGASIETVDKAVAFMNKTLAGGSTDSLAGALTAAKLKFADIRAMKPEDAFETIAEAIGSIEDPMMRARVAVALFGKSGQELLPAMVDGFKRVGDQAATMSNDTVAQLAKAGDAADRFANVAGSAWAKFIATMASALMAIPDAIDHVMNDRRRLVQDVESGIEDLVKGLNKQKAATGGATDSIAAANKALADFDKANKGNEDQLKKTWAAQDQYNASIREMANQLTGKKLDGEVRKLADALKVAGGAAKVSAYEKEKLGKQLGEMQSQGAKLTPELHKVWLEYEMLHPSIKTLTSTQAGFLDVLKAVTPIVTNLQKPIFALAQEMARTVKNDPTFVFKGLGSTLVPLRSIFSDTIDKAEELNKGIYKMQVEGASTAEIMDQFGDSALRAAIKLIQMGGSLDMLPPKMRAVAEQAMRAEAFDKMADNIYGIIEIGNTLADEIGGKWGKAISDYGKVVGHNMDAISAAMRGDMVGAINSGIKSLLAWKDLFAGIFGKGEGRQMVEEFAKTFGGFDALREKLTPLGTLGEKLWINLTQGVGKNNPEQAKAAIEAITKALQEQDALINGLVPSWQDTLALAEKYGIEVSGLGEKFAQAKLASMANDIAVDFRKLIAAGADMNAVLAGMQDEVQGVVSDALKMGLDIPDSMKPIIQKLIDMGTLTDENGNKLTDMSKLNFSETLSKSVERIIEALDRLIATLGGGVTDAIDKLPKNIEIKVGWKVGTIPGPKDSGETTQSFHNGGIIKAHNGMNKILPFGNMGAGEVPIIAQTGEAVLNRRAVARLGENGVAGLNGGGGGSVVDFSSVVAELRGQRADAKRAASMASVAGARAMRDALLLAR